MRKHYQETTVLLVIKYIIVHKLSRLCTFDPATGNTSSKKKPSPGRGDTRLVQRLMLRTGFKIIPTWRRPKRRTTPAEGLKRSAWTLKRVTQALELNRRTTSTLVLKMRTRLKITIPTWRRLKRRTTPAWGVKKSAWTLKRVTQALELNRTTSTLELKMRTRLKITIPTWRRLNLA